MSVHHLSHKTPVKLLKRTLLREKINRQAGTSPSWTHSLPLAHVLLLSLE